MSIYLESLNCFSFIINILMDVPSITYKTKLNNKKYIMMSILSIGTIKKASVQLKQTSVRYELLPIKGIKWKINDLSSLAQSYRYLHFMLFHGLPAFYLHVPTQL